MAPHVRKGEGQAQKELEDTLEAALDEGEPVEADDNFWNRMRAGFLANVESLEAAKKKMPKAGVDKRAERDIDEQLIYLYKEAGIEVALRFDKNLRYTFARLARFSEMGAPVPSERPRLKGLRKWRADDFERYLIFYLHYGAQGDGDQFPPRQVRQLRLDLL